MVAKNKVIRYGNQNTMFRKHQETLFKYEAVSNEIARLQKAVNQFEYDMKALEGKYVAEISAEVGVDGKPVFSNEKLRAAELTKRLHSNISYKELYDMHQDTSDQLLDARLNLDVLKRWLYFYEAR